MTQILSHGKWTLYRPDTLPRYAPAGALFARRESDGVDWYEYSRASANFSPDTVKFTAIWQDIYSGYVVGAATRDATQLFPAEQLLQEIIDYNGGDPQIELGQKLFDPDTSTLRDLPTLPPVVDPLEVRVAAIEARLGISK